MDPYLETRWADVHHRLVQYSCDALQRTLPSDLRARVEERVFVESDSEVRRLVAPDVHVYQRSAREPYVLREEGGTVMAEPQIFEVRQPEITEGYIEIRERGGGKVITVIEFLSPTNKGGGVGQQKYVEKQRDVLDSTSSLVEIDLVRSGHRVLALPAHQIPQDAQADYLACISAGWNHGRVELYRLPLRQRLPILPIPLRQEEARVHLDLQALVDEAYQKGGHDDLDYTSQLAPALTREEAEWVANILRRG
jgi:hypothetical protein